MNTCFREWRGWEIHTGVKRVAGLGQVKNESCGHGPKLGGTADTSDSSLSSYLGGDFLCDCFKPERS